MRASRLLVACLAMALPLIVQAQSGRISPEVAKAVGAKKDPADKPDKPDTPDGSGAVIRGEKVGNDTNPAPKADPQPKSQDSTSPADNDGKHPADSPKSPSADTKSTPSENSSRPEVHPGERADHSDRGGSPTPGTPIAPSVANAAAGAKSQGEALLQAANTVKQALEALRRVKGSPRPQIKVPRKEEVENKELDDAIETAIDLLKGYDEPEVILDAAVKVLTPSSVGTSQDLVSVEGPYPEELELARAVKALEDLRNNRSPNEAAAKRVQEAIDALRRQQSGEVKSAPPK
jgi:hypothetical protein